tara:strand:+ start:102 stop:599 length:498 start_codon:yes stop_codon:yes gene_type:complete
MIITCPNCNKQFKIDNSLIPDEGRDVQCGSCNNIWFHNIEKKNNKILNLTETFESKTEEKKIEKKEEIKVEKKIPVKKIETQTNKNKRGKTIEIQKNIIKSNELENKGNKFFSYLIVFIISSMALIILLDTFKYPLINAFPAIEFVLFNLFETLQDIKLFIIDLI